MAVVGALTLHRTERWQLLDRRGRPSTKPQELDRLLADIDRVVPDQL